MVRDQEVGGSNPLAPTIFFNHFSVPFGHAASAPWPASVRKNQQITYTYDPSMTLRTSQLNRLPPKTYPDTINVNYTSKL